MFGEPPEKCSLTLYRERFPDCDVMFVNALDWKAVFSAVDKSLARGTALTDDEINGANLCRVRWLPPGVVV